MNKFLLGLHLAFCLSPAVIAPATASEPLLSGNEISALLTGNTVVSTDSSRPFRQYFDGSGKTIYWPDKGAAEVGQWQVRGDAYCSLWPGANWTCYDMTGENGRVTWIDKSGGRFPGRVLKGRKDP